MAKTGGDISIVLEAFTSCHSSLKIQTCVGKLETESQEMEVELKRGKRERERTEGAVRVHLLIAKQMLLDLFLMSIFVILNSKTKIFNEV